eukprot:gene12118-14321_t
MATYQRYNRFSVKNSPYTPKDLSSSILSDSDSDDSDSDGSSTRRTKGAVNIKDTRPAYVVVKTASPVEEREFHTPTPQSLKQARLAAGEHPIHSKSEKRKDLIPELSPPSGAGATASASSDGLRKADDVKPLTQKASPHSLREVFYLDGSLEHRGRTSPQSGTNLLPSPRTNSPRGPGTTERAEIEEKQREVQYHMNALEHQMQGLTAKAEGLLPRLEDVERKAKRLEAANTSVKQLKERMEGLQDELRQGQAAQAQQQAIEQLQLREAQQSDAEKDMQLLGKEMVSNKEQVENRLSDMHDEVQMEEIVWHEIRMAVVSERGMVVGQAKGVVGGVGEECGGVTQLEATPAEVQKVCVRLTQLEATPAEVQKVCIRLSQLEDSFPDRVRVLDARLASYETATGKEVEQLQAQVAALGEQVAEAGEAASQSMVAGAGLDVLQQLGSLTKLQEHMESASATLAARMDRLEQNAPMPAAGIGAQQALKVKEVESHVAAGAALDLKELREGVVANSEDLQQMSERVELEHRVLNEMRTGVAVIEKKHTESAAAELCSRMELLDRLHAAENAAQAVTDRVSLLERFTKAGSRKEDSLSESVDELKHSLQDITALQQATARRTTAVEETSLPAVDRHMDSLRGRIAELESARTPDQLQKLDQRLTELHGVPGEVQKVCDRVTQLEATPAEALKGSHGVFLETLGMEMRRLDENISNTTAATKEYCMQHYVTWPKLDALDSKGSIWENKGMALITMFLVFMQLLPVILN